MKYEIPMFRTDAKLEMQFAKFLQKMKNIILNFLNVK